MIASPCRADVNYILMYPRSLIPVIKASTRVSGIKSGACRSETGCLVGAASNRTPHACLGVSLCFVGSSPKDENDENSKRRMLP